MEQRSTLAAVLLAIFGLALITRPAPNPMRNNTAATQPAAQQQKIENAPKPGIDPTTAWKSQCGEVIGPLQPLCTALYSADDKPPVEGAVWSEAPWVEHAKGRVTCVIAMVGDPDGTGDTLRFDRAIETIQSAAASLEYRMHRYWIPWHPRTGANAESTVGDLPGVLLFRAPNPDPLPASKSDPAPAPKSDSAAAPKSDPSATPKSDPPAYLAVFLVGESPVYGVEPLQFLNAVGYVRNLSMPADTVFIAGPNYSGSFSSLKKAIKEMGASQLSGEFRFISPSATVAKGGEAFDRTSNVTYHSIIHNDSYAGRHFRDYVKKRWGVEPAQQIALRESVTAFGRSVDKSAASTKSGQSEDDRVLLQRDSEPAAKPGIFSIQFPRGLFRLRNVSPEASASALFDTSGASGKTQRIPFTLKGTRVGLDSVPGLANDQVPVVQESELLAIASLMHERGAKLAQVVATDPYDWIFVAGFLHRVYPEARFWNANADLLIPRAVQQYPLEGSLAVTTFPLIARNQIWSRGPEMSVFEASSRYEFGLFNAFRAVLLEQAGTPPDALLEYSFPAHSRQDFPPLWLTAVGTNGYWPVALLDRNAAKPDSLQLPLKSTQSSASNAASDEWLDPGRPGDAWFAAWGIVVAAALILGAVLLVGASTPPLVKIISPWKRSQKYVQDRLFLKRTAGWPEDGGASATAYFASAAALMLCAMVLVIAGPVWMLTRHSGAPPAWAIVFSKLSAAAFWVSLAAAAMPQLACVFRKRRPRFDAYTGAGALIFVAFAAFCVVWMSAVSSGENYEAFFFTYRSLDLLNGVSPVLPFLLVGAGLFLLVILHQRRDALDRLRPDVPVLGDGPAGEDPSALAERVAEPLRNAFVSSQPLAWAIAALGLVTLFSLATANGQQSLESREYDSLFKSTFLALCVLVVFAWARFLIVSIRLRQMLDRLASHPLRMAFAALSPGYSISLLRGGGRRSVSDLLSDSMNVLQAAIHCTVASSELKSMKDDLSRIETAAKDCHRSEIPVTALANVHNALKKAGEHLAHSLQPLWREGISAAALRDEQAEESRKRACPGPLRSHQEFLAIQYAAFIGNAIRQLRSMLMYLTAGFFLGMSATLVYPFRSSMRLAWAGTINFILLGIPVIILAMRIEKHALIGELNSRQKGIQALGATARVAMYALLPIAAIVNAHFPELGRHLVSLLEPAMSAVR